MAIWLEVAIDALGLVVGTAVMGKGTEADDLVNFTQTYRHNKSSLFLMILF